MPDQPFAVKWNLSRNTKVCLPAVEANRCGFYWFKLTLHINSNIKVCLPVKSCIFQSLVIFRFTDFSAKFSFHRHKTKPGTKKDIHRNFSEIIDANIVYTTDVHMFDII